MEMQTISVIDSVNECVNESVVKHASYIDCLLQTNSGTIGCSKIMLATRSNFFHNIFSQKHNVGKFVNIVLTDCSFDAVKSAVDVILGMEVVATSKNINRVKHLLNKWQVKIKSLPTPSGVSDMEDKSEGKRESRVHFAEIAENEVNVSDIPIKRTRMNESKDPKPANVSKEEVDARSSKASDADSLLDWTITTSDVDVTSFRHSVIKRDGNKFKYKCDLCDNICNMYGLVKKHFFQTHKDFTNVSKILVDAEFERKIIDSSLTDIGKLVKKIKS